LTSARDQQIRAIYRAALERSPGERSAFVAALTGEDTRLRESVEQLLSRQDATALAASPTDAGATLATGALIGHYRIDRVLGSGGMGIVYEATDTKLGRPVAIKFLTAPLADADARRRFRQEAETASSLHHPHIVTVYDVGEHDGRQYIVSELVEGGTLEDWAGAAKRSWRQSTELLTGVADALAAAHAAGVLHRDVKPGNILVDANGYAKLADFGLAKLVGADASGAEAGHTRQGMVVGTVAYMSPEQAAGQPLDARSDVFSFGIVLYELLAGRRPFDGASDLEVLKAIAHAAPAPLPDGMPELLKLAVDKALEKEPADRYQTMQDFVADLRRATRKSGSPSAKPPAVPRRRTRWAWWGGAGLGIAASVVAAVAAWPLLRSPTAPKTRMHFTIAVPGYQLGGLAISPDGKRIAYASTVSGSRQLWIRPIDALEPHVLAGSDDAQGPFWSPDSRNLAFSADGKLKKVDADGGPVQTVADALFAGSWSRGGTILYNATATVLGFVTAAGREGSWPPHPQPSDGPRVLPSMLPDGDHFLYVSPWPGVTSSGRALFLGSLANGESKRLADLAVGDAAATSDVFTTMAYADGFLVYLLSGNGGTLMALPFDADALAVRGQAQPIAENVGEFSVSSTGVLIYHERPPAPAPSAGAGNRRRAVWVDRRGERLAQVDVPAEFRLPVLSSDGSHLVFSVHGENGAPDIWTMDLARGTETRITFDDAVESAAVWSPDGKQLVFSSARNALPALPSALYRHAANGTGADELLLKGERNELFLPWDWSPDGRFVVFGRGRFPSPNDRSDLWTLDLSGGLTARALIESPERKGAARFSPDGRWIVYATGQTNASQVIVQPFPNVDHGRWQISTEGGDAPKWRADGRELYYLAPNGDLMAVDVDGTGDVFTSGAPHTLFRTT
jgi:Tol biopolymer transport system component